MPKFIKKDKNSLLSYDRDQYLEFLGDDFNSQTKWVGYSLQLVSYRDPIKSLSILNETLKKLLAEYEDDSFWNVNHDDKDMKWFPDSQQNLKNLRELFRNHGIPNDFIGVISFSKHELLQYFEDLVSYPYLLSYKNLDISNSELPIIIKITSHLSLDLLSTEISLLEKILDKNFTDLFKKIGYR